MLLLIFRNNRIGGTTSLRSRTCVKRSAVFGAHFKSLSLYFLYQKGNLIRIKTGLNTYLIRIQTRIPLSRYPPYDYSKFVWQTFCQNGSMAGSLGQVWELPIVAGSSRLPLLSTVQGDSLEEYATISFAVHTPWLPSQELLESGTLRKGLKVRDGLGWPKERDHVNKPPKIVRTENPK